jgi:hypothetical protein
MILLKEKNSLLTILYSIIISIVGFWGWEQEEEEIHRKKFTF